MNTEGTYAAGVTPAPMPVPVPPPMPMPRGGSEPFEPVFDAADAAMLVLDADLRAPGPAIVYANRAMAALTGHDAGALAGRPLRLLREPDDDAAEPWRRRLECDGRHEGEATTRRGDGSRFRGHWTVTAIPRPDGGVRGWLAVLREAAPGGCWPDDDADEDDHRRTVLEGIPHLVWQSHDGGEWCAASPQWVAFTGQEETASLGGGWRGMIAPEDRADTDAAWRGARGAGVMAVEHRIRRHDGAYRWFQTRALPVGGGDDPDHRLWIGTSTDIDDLRAAQERIRHLAFHDGLTDIGNRGMLREVLDRMTAATNAVRPFNLFLLDVDDFKAVNDQLGHRGGDEALQEIARRMASWTRDGDAVARLGGDEFVLVQADASPADGLVLAERIRTGLGQSLLVAQHELRLSARIGMACFPGDGADADALLRRADLALNGAKTGARTGGDVPVRRFERSMELARHERQALHSGLAEAIERGELHVAYQAMCCAETGVVQGYEALARWTHPRLGVVPPTTFIPVAEESGLIGRIGEWMLERACADAAGPEFAGRRVSVNLSPVQFRAETLPRMVAAALERGGLPPERLELEVTERLLIDHDDDARRILHELKALGVAIALDDFGIGYSNLGYLCNFPFDRLKIDRSFVQQMVEDGGARAVVSAVIALAHDLRLCVTAEGVETELQLAMLRGMGCDQVQGFLFGRPVPASVLPGPSGRAGSPGATGTAGAGIGRTGIGTRRSSGGRTRN